MVPTDRKAFVETLNGLAAIKPGKELTREALQLWWTAMNGWSIEEFRAAASHLASAVEFMPSPFHFEQLRRASKPTADEAWQIALDRCKQWRTPREVLDSVDRTAAAIGGYRVIALADEEYALPHVQRRFLDAYDKIDAATDVRQALPSLATAPQLPAPRSNCRDGRFAAINAPAPAPKVALEQAKPLAEQSREKVTEWLKSVGA